MVHPQRYMCRNLLCMYIYMYVVVRKVCICMYVMCPNDSVTYGIYMYNTVYGRRGYCEVIERVAEECMQKAVEEVKARPDYESSGEVLFGLLWSSE